MKFKHITLVSGLFLQVAVYAQDHGRVFGSVADPNGKLPGATVTIQELSHSTETDLKGEFSLNNIPPGTYTVVVSYIGHDDMVQEISISSGQVNNLGTLTFSAATEELDAIVINSYQAPSQAKAYNIQKNAAGIMNVIASDAIGKLPDRNAAEAVQRISGVSIERDHGEGRYVTVRGTPLQWNSTLINGSRMPTSEGTSDNSSGTRTSPLDIFPSEMIEYVQLSKAITPDMEGDAIGGSVNFITKTAPDRKILNLTASGGYNDQVRKGLYGASFLYGDRSKNEKFGYMVAASYWKRNWGTDNMEIVYNPGDHSIENLQLRDYNGIRRTAGINTGFEYKFNYNHKLFLRAIYTDFQDDERAVENIYNFTADDFTMRVRQGIVGINLYGGEFGGIHNSDSGKWKFDWKTALYATEMEARKPKGSNSKYSSYLLAMFSTPMTYNRLAPDGKRYLDIDGPAGYRGDSYKNLAPRMNGTVTPDDMLLTQLIAIDMGSYERDWVGELNLEHRPSEKLTIKTGAKLKIKYLERGNPMNIFAYLGGNDHPVSMGSLGSSPFPYNGGFLSELGDTYRNSMMPGISLDQLGNLFSEENLNNPLFYHIGMDENNPNSAASFYKGNEDVYAAYVMGDYRLGNNLRMIGGIRYEHTKIKYTGNEVTIREDKTAEIKPATSESSFNAFLPMVHLKYSPQNNFNVRFAYTRTFARANFSDLNPTESRSLLSTPPTISRGNIDLKPTFANNFDLLGEYFFDDIGIVNAGVFYKSLENVIYTAQNFQVIEGNLYRLTQPENSESGWLAGFEVGINKRLSFLPGVLSGLGVDANYTFTKSEMQVPNYSVNSENEVVITKSKEALPNQSKHIFNAALFYEKGKTMVRIAGNFKGEALAVVQGNPENYRWYDKNFTVDLSASYKISKKITAFVEVNNLTNAPLRYYQGTSNRPEQLEYYSLRGMAGVNINLF